MTRTLTRTFVTLTLLVVLFNGSTFACGPFAMEAVFVFTAHPAFPLERYARGEIGVIQPSYARSYLYVAYRYLSNSPLTPQEQKALSTFWDERLNGADTTGEEGWVKAWIEARQKVSGLPPSSTIEVFRNREKPNEYESYLNCRQDSFETAISTLNERIRKYGTDAPLVRTWIEGQDQVFANCAAGRNIPTALSSSADALARADRNYQIAAANFYSTNLEEARKAFDAIATDSSSPWHTVAPYLVARTLIRKASLGPEETKNNSLGQAESQLRQILDNKKLAPIHAAAQRLLNLVRLRLHPAERMHELANTLLSKTENEQLKQDLWDYTTLLDGAFDTAEPGKTAGLNDNLRTDPLTDWLATLQSSSSADLDHAVSRWQATHTSPWLVAVLSKVDGSHSGINELVREALAVKPNSPAFASARFHAVRLLMALGKSAEARSLLDQLLKNNRAQFDASSLNLLLSERMMVATSFDDFLVHAPRMPAALSWNDDGRELPSAPSEVADENKAIVGKALFDYDAAKVLNTQVPLELLKEAALKPALPTHLRVDIAQAVWIRAILLGNYRIADELVPTLKELVPEMTGGLDDFSKISQPEAKKFSALYTWLKYPGVEPIIDMGIGRESPLSQQDSYRDNWWCGSATPLPTEPVSEENDRIGSFTSRSLPGPIFLSDAQLAAAKKEWTALKGLGAMPNYFSKQVIQWATKSPGDPRVPEALHLAVNSTRYGCADEQTGRWSKAAFDLLHRKYPNSPWAKKTKYWFKE